ncbi:MAG: hypothetical protein ABIO81_13600 [Ginsengibacter sp.]
MEKLLNLLTELESKVPNSEKLDLSISKSPVGWHIEHTLMTTIQIIEALENSNPQDYKWKFNLPKVFIYAINKIPRGRGKAPKSVQPKGAIVTDNLKKNILVAKMKVKELTNLDSNNYFEHPYFGKLNLKPTIRFLKIHTKHHIEIINDIIKG